jgi:hypothetical protein
MGQALIIDIKGESGEASRETSVESRGQLKKKWLVAGEDSAHKFTLTS